jgi:uncharacterized repeat protein (TIGR01451 family)
MKTRHLLIPAALGVGLVLALMWLLTSTLPDTVLAAESTARVADRSTPIDRCALSQAGVITVCVNAACDYSSIQAAVDEANPGTIIQIAGGVYSDVHARGTAGNIITQVVYVGKNLTLRGGYSATNWAANPDPIANPTTLDGRGQGRVFFIERETNVVINGLRIVGGDANRGDAIAPGAVERGGRGGGLYASDATVTFTDNWVSDNTATRGGGLYLKAGTINLSGNTVGSNTADYGGGAYLVDFDVGLGVATFDNNTFTSNTATGSITVTGQGGGILLLRSDGTTLNSNIIIANSAGNGGGLYLRESDTSFVNNIVADNIATSAGGGLYVDASSPNLKHTAFARNSGNEGIYVTGASEVELVNTIISTHTLGLSVASGSDATLDTTLWYNNTPNWSGSGVHASNNRAGDPAFEDPDAGDYHIRFYSAALDWAVPADVDTDIDEDERPRGDGFDLGPDEYPDFLSVEKKASPSPVRPGEQLVYEIQVTNYGGQVYTATITDFLPDQLIYSDIVTRWTDVTLIPDDEVPWKGYITVTVDPDHRGALTNTVVVTTVQGESGGTYIVIQAYAVYLPIVMRGS